MRRTLLALVAVAAGLAATGLLADVATRSDAASPPDHASEHERIVRYWTPGRVARAIPRDIVVGGPPAAAPAPSKGKPGGGGGSGGGTTCPSGTATVRGATWTCGGAVAKTTGKVLFTLGGVDYVCSGSVVDDGDASAGASNTRSLVLTAAHCMYDDAEGAFASNWLFIPAYQDGGSFGSCDTTTTFGCWTATALVTTSAFASPDASLAHDYGFAVTGAGGKAGAPQQLDTAVGAQAIAFDTAPGAQVFAFGYPAAGKYKGRSLVYCAGLDFLDPYGSGDVGLSCDMTGGSSGGPWFKDFDPATGEGVLTSVNSFYYYSLKSVMFGPVFGDYTAQTYTAALAASDCALVAEDGTSTPSACP